MRKNYLSVIVLTVVLFVVGCDEGSQISKIDNQSGTTLLRIERCLLLNANPSLTILANEIIFDYNKRIIVIKGLINITGDDGGCYNWIVPEINIKEGDLVINIPSNFDYKVKIGENRFYLPLIKK